MTRNIRSTRSYIGTPSVKPLLARPAYNRRLRGLEERAARAAAEAERAFLRLQIAYTVDQCTNVATSLFQEARLPAGVKAHLKRTLKTANRRIAPSEGAAHLSASVADLEHLLEELRTVAARPHPVSVVLDRLFLHGEARAASLPEVDA